MFKRLAQNTFLHILILVAVAVFTFLPTLDMFFYLDEFGNLYDFTHGDYRGTAVFTANVFYQLYKLFGINATGYFAVGTLIFALSVVIFYFFVSSLLKSKLLGLIAGLIYATTPVGTNTVFMIWTFVMEGGYPLTVALLGLLYAHLTYFRKHKIFFYLFLVFGFFLFLELEPRRVFLFLPVLVVFDYLINFKRIFPSLGFFARVLPLLIVFIAYYKYDVTLSKIISTGTIVLTESASTYDWQTKLNLGVTSLTHTEPLITLTNILLAGPWLFASERLAGFVDLADIREVYLLVAITLSFALVLLVVAWRIKIVWGLTLLFSILWIYINILGIYVFSSPGVSESNHRTLSLAAGGYALFVTIAGASLYTLFAKRSKKFSKKLNKIFILLLFVLLATNLMSTRHNFEKFNDFRNKPARAFFSDLKDFYPTLPADSIIYIEASGNPQIRHRLNRIYGGSNYGPGATIAIFYPERTMKEIEVVRDFVQVEKLVGDDPSRIDRVFAFYYDENGLSDKTSDIRSRLRK